VKDRIARPRGVPPSVTALLRALRYLSLRGIAIFLTVLCGIYAAIWVTNLGGYADAQKIWEIEFAVGMTPIQASSNEERQAIAAQMVESMIEAHDLNRPFWQRSFGYFRDAFTFSLGRTGMTSPSGSSDAIDVITERLPPTLLIFGTANVITFFGSLIIALFLARRFGSLIDRLATLLVPLLSAPPWFHGIVLIVVFASILRILPFGNIVDARVSASTFGYVLSILKHMILPVSACVLGTLPMAVYANRALFLTHAGDSHVELARAKGLSVHRLQKRYILRPVLPPVITSFALVAIGSWQAIILTEIVFSWPGLGALLIDAITHDEVAVVVGAVTLFAYLLGFTVLFLDLIYVLVDPRIALGGGRNR